MSNQSNGILLNIEEAHKQQNGDELMNKIEQIKRRNGVGNGVSLAQKAAQDEPLPIKCHGFGTIAIHAGDSRLNLFLFILISSRNSTHIFYFKLYHIPSKLADSAPSNAVFLRSETRNVEHEPGLFITQTLFCQAMRIFERLFHQSHSP